MQQTQNAFSFSKSSASNPFLVGSKPSAQSPAKRKSGAKNSGRDEDTSFGATLNQAVKKDSDRSRESRELKSQEPRQTDKSDDKKTPSPKQDAAKSDAPEKPVGLAQDAEASVESEEALGGEAVVLLENEGMISNALSDLLNFLKGLLNQEGEGNPAENPGEGPCLVDNLEALSAQLGELLGRDWRKALSNLNAEQITGLLSKLRERYAVDAEGKGADSPELEMDRVLGDFKVALEELLKQQGGGMVTVKEGEEENPSETLPLAPGANAANTADAIPDEVTDEASLQLSRIFSTYLKPEALKPKAEVKKAGQGAGGEGEKDGEAAAPVDADSEQTVLPLSVAGSGTERQPDGEKPQANPQIGLSAASPEKDGAPKDVSPVDSFAEGPAESLKEGDGAQAVNKTTAEPRTNFEQFFQNVLSHRGRFEARGAEGAQTLDLTKGTPLPQGETLREGVDNVIRFIRTSGEQKAALIVDPPALGRLTVELTTSTAGLEASIKVGSEQVRQLIQDQLTQLRLSLEQQGVQLTHFSVDVQQDNGERSREQNAEQKRHGATRADMQDQDDEETTFRVDLNEGLLSWVA